MGYVDLQVNGYAGVDFNGDELDETQLLTACERLAADGVDQILATIITAPIDKMIKRIGTLARLIEGDRAIQQMIGGLHIEGPFLNPVAGFIGAHPSDCAQVATVDVAQRLIDAAGGYSRLLTLAPEMDPHGAVTKWLADQGVTVAAGHSDASLDQLRCGLDNGLRMFTHLGNGCPPLLARHDNIIQRVLYLSDQLMISFIADGHHVPDFALANYLKQVPDNHIVIVSDAISAAGLGAGEYRVSDQTVYVDEDGAAWAAARTHYAGCATPLAHMAAWLKSKLGIGQAQIEQWFEQNPKRLLHNNG
jgi:N-acetylglucosamine-6-phosphate deacetylase